jgi:hypothetical protein
MPQRNKPSFNGLGSLSVVESEPPLDRVEDVVEALYQAILERGADEGGTEHYARMLKEHGLAGGLVPAIRELLASEEFRALMRREG